jgi:hypothetical protein
VIDVALNCSPDLTAVLFLGILIGAVGLALFWWGFKGFIGWLEKGP